MKLFTYAFACLFSFAWISVSQAQEEITEEDKNQQEKVLKQDPKDFAANYIVGAYYYNLAVDPHMETTKMKIIEYLEEGSPYEKKKDAFLKKALPYFENAYAVQKEQRVTNVLKTIYQELGTLKKTRISAEELQKQLQAKLDTIEFKPIEE